METSQDQAAAQERNLETLITRRAHEIAELEIRRAIAEFLARVQTTLALEPPTAPAAEAMPEPSNGYLTVKEAARTTGLNENTIRRAIALKKLPAARYEVRGPRGPRRVLKVSAIDLHTWRASASVH